MKRTTAVLMLLFLQKFKVKLKSISRFICTLTWKFCTLDLRYYCCSMGKKKRRLFYLSDFFCWCLVFRPPSNFSETLKNDFCKTFFFANIVNFFLYFTFFANSFYFLFSTMFPSIFLSSLIFILVLISPLRVIDRGIKNFA